MEQSCYVKSPDISENYIVFVSDDDVWRVARDDDYASRINQAIRLTGNRHHVECPKISPDQKYVAFLSDESGDIDCYLIPMDGGIVSRLTFFGDARIVGWKDSKTVLVSSANESFKVPELYEIAIDGSEVVKKKVGAVSYFSEIPRGIA